MNRIDSALARARAEDRPLFVPFWVLGDPDEQTALSVLRALVDAGADALELGLPFSDPPADGPVIQAAQTRALSAGITPPRALALVRRLREHTDVPLLLMAYANLLDAYEGGVEGFAAAASHAGIDALLVPDAPLEETLPFEEACRRQDLCLAQMVTELTPRERLTHIAARATGYLYVVARAGTTGTHAGVGGRLDETIARARSVTGLPLFVGFGVASADDVARVRAAGADAVIVGSALVREADGSAATLAERVGSRAAALREGGLRARGTRMDRCG
jgi:tryptophan synthase alpha chain